MSDRRVRIFVVRTWTEPDGSAGRWRASVRGPHSGTIRYFEDPRRLLAYLLRCAHDDDASDDAAREPP